MKKFAIFCLLILVVLSTTMVGCDTNEGKIRLNEVTHSIFYAPLYIAMNKGYFEDYGIEIELTNGGGSDQSMTALLSNSADIALLGPETAVYVASQGREDLPVVFGQLTKRDGSFIISKENKTFSWNDLIGKEILGGRTGGMPAMTLEYVLKNKGIFDQVNINYDVAFNNMTAAFIGGTGDYMTTFEPTGSTLEKNNQAYIATSVGLEAGEVPFTTFMATSSYLEDNPELIKNFLKAIMKGYNYLTTANIDDVVNALLPSFADSDREIIKSSLQNYIDIDAWVATPIMTQSSYDKLLDIMTMSGTLEERIPFSDIVDNTYAQEVINDMIAS
ncbi:MAG: ABC transporter substrate-binding protein [Clostridiales bacterium]|nr:ABC transporter substrate-binding protein [Clostridiales bacterium]